MVLCLTPTCRVFGQIHDRFGDVCPSLQNASPPDLLQFLNGVVPDEKNGWCTTWAIYRLGDEHYEPAIAALVKLLDFRRPPTQQEKMGFYLHAQSIQEVFPAALALAVIGRPALPEVLRAMQTTSTSARARENAVSVWMEAYKYERPKGIALLKQEEAKANNDTTKQNLRWAVQKALTHCGLPGEKEGTSCRQAAATAVP